MLKVQSICLERLKKDQNKYEENLRKINIVDILHNYALTIETWLKENNKLNIIMSNEIATIIMDLYIYSGLYYSKSLERFIEMQKQNLDLYNRKNADYGSAFIKYGLLGVLIRMDDKIQRIINLTKNGTINVINESLMDTFNDLNNYAMIALSYMT